MRPRHIVLALAIAAAAALVVMGPLRGRSIEDGVHDIAGGLTAALSGAMGRTVQATSPALPPPEITVSQPVAHRTIEWDEYTGRFDAVEAVDVRARISGYLTEVNFVDGQAVKAGDLLFQIDPRPFERALDQAQAQLDEAKVRVSNANLNVERGRPLLKTEAISRKAFDDRENLVREATAAVKVAEARVKTAELELSFCRITAPISGRISRTLVTRGNFVSGGGSDTGSTLLTTIVSQTPIYIYFDVSENNALKYQRLAQASGKGATGIVGAAVGVGLPDEQRFPHSGKLDFLENRLDAGTGTLRARAIIDNTDGLFSPSMFAHVRLQGSPEYEALLLPDEAIGTDQATRFVYVVGDNDVPERHTVELGPLVDGLRVVRKGIGSDDWVVIRGQQRILPDQKITPKRAPIAVSEGHDDSLSAARP